MSTLRIGYYLIRADLLERVRRNSFLIILVITGYGCYLFVPPADANYITFAMGKARGIYNSPWVGTMFGFFASMMLPLLGFYLKKTRLPTIEKRASVRSLRLRLSVRECMCWVNGWAI